MTVYVVIMITDISRVNKTRLLNVQLFSLADARLAAEALVITCILHMSMSDCDIDYDISALIVIYF